MRGGTGRSRMGKRCDNHEPESDGVREGGEHVRPPLAVLWENHGLTKQTV